jgi:hypothetical protein
MGPSVSYSITVRLEVASRGRAVSEIIPSVFHPDVASSVAVAVRDAATEQPER